MKSNTLCPVKSNYSGKRYINIFLLCISCVVMRTANHLNPNVTKILNIFWALHFFFTSDSHCFYALSFIISSAQKQSKSDLPVPARGTCWCSQRDRSYLHPQIAPWESHPEPSGRSYLAVNPGPFPPQAVAHLDEKAEQMRELQKGMQRIKTLVEIYVQDVWWMRHHEI